ncbi:serpin-ZX-like [Bidens hawaiensis]|uniref:serpin-ZX-like n=1 Tax=Bidens hawaiensis TaxID=980011 RepID=UPI00404AD539
MSDIEQSISNQTHVSTIMATHLLSNKHDSNVVFSPLAMQAGLSLVAAGSKGRTLDQLLAFLKTNTIDDLNSLYSQLVSETLVDGSPNDGPQLSFVNGVWLEKTLSLKPSFKKVVKTVYKAACKRVDFKTEAVKVAERVNSWAEKQTNGLIKDVLPAASVDNLTRLIFANAIYFKGTWSRKFNQSTAKEHDFHLLDGNKFKVPFMTSRKKQLVCEYDDFKVLDLSYLQGLDERKFTMYVFLPNAKDGLQSLVQKIGSTSDFLDRHILHRQVEVGRFLVPKFKISFWFEASSMLKELGLVLPFGYDCDLTKLADSTASESLHVSSINHKAYVDVCEEDTEAAAVNIMMMRYLSARPPKVPKSKVDFVADHPFLFVIREDVSGVMLFMGQVIDPRAG